MHISSEEGMRVPLCRYVQHLALIFPTDLVTMVKWTHLRV